MPVPWQFSRRGRMGLALIAGGMAALLTTTILALSLGNGGRPVWSWRVAIQAAAQWYFWVAAAPIVVHLARYRPSPVRLGTAAIVLTFTHAAITLAVHTAVRPYVVAGSLLHQYTIAVLDWTFMDTVLFATIVLLTRWASAAAREREREYQAAALTTEVARARLSALRMQLRPHFLFNALNTITVLVRERDADTAASLLTRLGDLLKHVLRDDLTNAIPLEDEIAVLRDYLAIEEVRFADRLRVIWSVDEITRRAWVPPLILQPLVENAFRHAIARRPGRRLLEIGAAAHGDHLRLWVRDDGPGLANGSGQTRARRGVGLANTRARLQCLYGSRASLDIANGPDGGVFATVDLPLVIGA